MVLETPPHEKTYVCAVAQMLSRDGNINDDNIMLYSVKNILKSRYHPWDLDLAYKTFMWPQ